MSELRGLLVCLLMLTACTAPAPREPLPTPLPSPLPTPAPQATPVTVAQATGPAPALPLAPLVRAVGSPSPLALPLSLLAGRSGADVRVALNLLLQEHVFMLAMASAAAGSARLEELGGSLDALDQNSITLAEIVGAVKGQNAAQALLDGWRGVVADVIAYAQGQQVSASADIDRRRSIIAAQLAMGDFSSSAADDVLRQGFQTQLSLTDSIIARDPAQSSQRLRSAAAASDELARPLAAAIAQQAPALASPPTEGLDIDVRLSVTRALQEHTYLVGAALDAAADGRVADQQALLDAAAHTASDLGSQLASVYGPDLGNGVADRLRAETAALVSAASGGDRRKAADDIDRVRGELDHLLAQANPLLPAGLVSQQLRTSDQPLLVAADAFAARDWPTAYARLRESARQSQKAADTLAQAIVDRYPLRYLVLPTPTAANQ
jgi:hypothetical protein